MSRKYKYSYGEKLKICEDYVTGRHSGSEIARGLGKDVLPGNIWLVQEGEQLLKNGKKS